MARKTDYLAKAARKQITPYLKEQRFTWKAPRGYYRVRGRLIDAVVLDYGRWGQNFDIVYYVNPIYELDGRILSGYVLGKRWGQYDWDASTEESAERSVGDALVYLKETIMPWFEDVDGLETFLQKLVAKGEPVYKMGEILTLAVLGREHESLALLERTRKDVVERFMDETTRQILVKYDEFELAVKEGRLSEYIEMLMRRNLEEAKIDVSSVLGV